MTLLVNRISKTFGAVQAVREVSFSCESSSITGFIGPNGSGKSTTLKIVAGLVKPDSGTVLFNGQPYASLANPGREVGFLLDPTAHHPGRSVRETALLSAIMMGHSKSRVHEVLEAVGLATVSRRRVQTLSLGMRQRLSLAIALLGEPKCLILDEPGNGLDVEGMAWLNEALRLLALDGVSILVSSHLLSELETYVDQVVIIDRGMVVAAESLEHLKTTDRTHVSGPELRNIELALREAGLSVEAHDGYGSHYLEVRALPELVGEILWKKHLQVNLLQQGKADSLAEFYKGITSPEFASPNRTDGE
ncbi:ATP-binding cassette domain-containing protein [Sinomonas sp. ASV322]|uniref:ABC transporter ATP-binding protein n=1 Tax=Sinomonas sp. ASV322 TaxID=3041920 RepID=UPI0027DDDC5C|nr:ATP-binding cassette domain-containing protein [Sinomonas sp. ASV322]MDQ4502375.1 ATP-binding cassette domain-containing protein [Sinomonas sp. ASV322]